MKRNAVASIVATGALLVTGALAAATPAQAVSKSVNYW